MANNLVKVNFRLKKDEDGFPNVDVESLWAKHGLKKDEYVLDNIPFFVCAATIGDTLVALKEDGNLWFSSLVRHSGNSLIRVVFFDQNAFEKINRILCEIGCSTEYSKDHNILAINVPSNVSLLKVQAFLQTETAFGKIDYEEQILRQGDDT